MVPPRIVGRFCFAWRILWFGSVVFRAEGKNMKTVMVRYKTSEAQADANEGLARIIAAYPAAGAAG